MNICSVKLWQRRVEPSDGSPRAKGPANALANATDSVDRGCATSPLDIAHPRGVMGEGAEWVNLRGVNG